MSKIEKALTRAKQEGGNVRLLPAARGAPLRTSTALVSEPLAHPEAIARMAASEIRLRSQQELHELRIISKERMKEPVVQVFRELRTRIMQLVGGRSCTILVAAVSVGGGGSFVARNLGAAIAFDPGKTTLLVDCNLRNPSAHRLIPDWAGGAGLMDYLDEPDLDLAEIIYPVGIPRYRVMPAGVSRDMPLEYFTSPKMRHLMDSVRYRYAERFIVIDGPEMSDIADVRILSEFADYVLIVARYGRTTSEQISNAVSAINDQKLLGVVLNDEPNIWDAA